MATRSFAREPGPFSSVFPYEELKAEEEERLAKRQEAQQRIARTNVIGEALRIVSDAIGGSQGGTILPREQTGVAGAAQRFYRDQEASDQYLQKLRLSEIAAGEKDLSWQLAQRQREQDYQRQRAGRKEDLDIALQQKEADWARQAAERQDERKWREGESEKERQARAVLSAQQHAQQMELIEARKKTDTAEPEEIDPYMARWNKVSAKKQPYIVLPDTEHGFSIPLNEGQASQILKWMRNDPSIDPYLLGDIDPRYLSNNLTFKNLIIEHWDRYKDLVRKMGGGQPVSEQDVQGIYERANRQKRMRDYQREMDYAENISNKRRKERYINETRERYSDLFEEFNTLFPEEAEAPRDSFDLTEDQDATIDKMLSATGYSTEDKRTAMVNYLMSQGKTAEEAGSYIDYLLQHATGR
jgi:hypothetical protein